MPHAKHFNPEAFFFEDARKRILNDRSNYNETQLDDVIAVFYPSQVPYRSPNYSPKSEADPNEISTNAATATNSQGDLRTIEDIGAGVRHKRMASDPCHSAPRPLIVGHGRGFEGHGPCAMDERLRDLDKEKTISRRDPLMHGSRHHFAPNRKASLTAKLSIENRVIYGPMLKLTVAISWTDALNIENNLDISIRFSEHYITRIRFRELDDKSPKDVRLVHKAIGLGHWSYDEAASSSRAYLVELHYEVAPDTTHLFDTNDGIYGPYLGDIKLLRAIVRRELTVKLFCFLPKKSSAAEVETLWQTTCAAASEEFVVNWCCRDEITRHKPGYQPSKIVQVPHVTFCAKDEYCETVLWAAYNEANHVGRPIDQATKEMQEHLWYKLIRHFDREQQWFSFYLSATSSLLTGHRYDRLQLEDTLANIDESILSVLRDKLERVTNQVLLLEYLRAVPYGLTILDGVAGSGKTTAVQFLLAAQYQQHLREPKSPFQILWCSPLDKQNEDVALSLQAQLSSHNESAVVLLLSKSVLDEISFTSFDSDHDIESHTTQHATLDSLEKRTLDKMAHILDDMAVVANIHKGRNYKTLEGRKSGITARNYKLTEAYHLLRLCGLLPPERTQDGFFMLKWIFKELHGSIMKTGLSIESKHKKVYECMCHVLRSADVVVCTTSTALALPNIRNLTPTMLVCDESGRVSELHSAGLIACYPSTQWRIFLTDHAELGVFQQSSEDKNIFAAQGRIALSSRLMAAGFPTLVMSYQARFDEEICKSLALTFHGGFMHTAVAYVDDHATLKCTIKSLFKVTLSAFAIDVTDRAARETIVTVHHSRVNAGTANAALNVAAKVVRESGGLISMKDVQIITSYLSQKELLRMGQHELAKQRQDPMRVGMDAWKDLLIWHIDHAKYTRWLTIIDITGTENPGHMRDARRLYTALSRTSGMVILVGNFTRLYGSGRRYGPDDKLEQYYQYLRTAGSVATLPADCKVGVVLKLQQDYIWKHKSMS